MYFKEQIFKDRAYKPRVFLTQYNDMYFRLTYCKNCRNSLVEFPQNKKTLDPVTEKFERDRVSISRTIRSVRDYAFANDFTYFATITVNSKSADRFSLEDCQQKLKTLLKSLKRKNSNFIYLFITEKHKDGAFHFHGLISEIPFYVNKNGYFSSKDFDKLGFNSFSKIRDKNKCCNYILKYITKDFVRNDTHQIYISSRGLKRPDRYEITQKDFSKLKFITNNRFENDFVIFYDCYNDSSKPIKLKPINTASDN